MSMFNVYPGSTQAPRSSLQRTVVRALQELKVGDVVGSTAAISPRYTALGVDHISCVRLPTASRAHCSTYRIAQLEPVVRTIPRLPKFGARREFGSIVFGWWVELRTARRLSIGSSRIATELGRI